MNFKGLSHKNYRKQTFEVIC
ncbi:hypothetical protein ACP2X0_10930 [Staphylococcus epidermidis]